MSTDIKKHSSIASGEKPTRAGLAAAILSINDIVPVANATEANQVATALVSAGVNLANTPLTVRRADAAGLHTIEVTKDGTNWAAASAVQHFTTDAARDAWTTTNSSLLTSGDRCVSANLEYRWRYGGWVSVDPLIAVNTSGTQAGITTAVTVTGISVPVTLASTGALRVTAGLTHYASNVDTLIYISVKDGATVLTTWVRPANSSPTAASTGSSSSLQMILPSIGSGTHTLTLEVSRAAGTGTITVAPSTTNQTFLSVEVI